MVHAVVVNEARKRITLIFRGSVTQQDFIQDVKCVQVKVDNPAAHISEPSSTPTINLHSGFYGEFSRGKSFKIHGGWYSTDTFLHYNRVPFLC